MITPDQEAAVRSYHEQCRKSGIPLNSSNKGLLNRGILKEDIEKVFEKIEQESMAASPQAPVAEPEPVSLDLPVAEPLMEPDPFTNLEAEKVSLDPQPDSNGEFKTPLDGALWMALTYGIPQTPLKDGDDAKVPRLPAWQTTASTNSAQIKDWWDQYHCNFGSVAHAGKHFIFEADSTAVRDRFKQAGGDFTSKLIIESSPGKGHRYYLAAAGIKNIGQDKSEDFSIRANNEQCVSPGSIHPTTKKQYRVAVSNGQLTAPTQQEIDFWNSQRKPEVKISEQAMIPSGRRNSTLNSMAGKYIDLGETVEQVKERIRVINQERCSPPLTDGELDATIFKSIVGYAKKPDSITRKVNESIAVVGSSQAAAAPGGRRMTFVRGDSIKPVRLKWLWNGRILADKINAFSGEPGIGKGLVTIYTAARVTTNQDFIDCKNELGGCKDVLFLSSEDDMQDTIVPQLKVAGADLSKVHFVEMTENASGTTEEGIVCLDHDLPLLEMTVKQHPDIALIIIDPAIAFLGNANPNKDEDVRPIYSKMKTLAKRLGVAILCVHHWNKNTSATSINRTSGAKTFVSAPRATWMFSQSPEDTDVTGLN